MAYRPTAVDVANEMPTRTVRPAGELDPDGDTEGGTFTDTTRPTVTQVETVIDEALALLAPRLGTAPTELTASARAIVTLRAAMLIERRYFPDDVDADRSLYAALRDELAEALTAYDAARDGNAAGQAVPRVVTMRVATLLSGL